MDTTSLTHSPLVSTDATATRHPGLYFPTGDLVVSARASDDGGLHLFRVHTVILGQFSPVFADMLKMPSGNHGRETHDGVPVVHFPDEAKDVTELFRAFYRPGIPHFKRNDPNFPTEVYGLMKIATKYQVDSICQAIKSHLESEWPTTLAELLRLKADMDMARGGLLSLPELEQAKRDIHNVFPEPTSAIRLAMDFGITKILPAAFYMLSSTPFDPMPLYATPSDRLAMTRFAVLNDQETLRYYRGRDQLMKEQALVYVVLTGGLIGYDDCGRNVVDADADSDSEEDEDELTLCQMTFSTMQTETIKKSATFSYPSFVADPMRYLMDIMKELRKEKSRGAVCSACFDSTKEIIGETMERTWDSLTTLFDLPKGRIFRPHTSIY